MQAAAGSDFGNLLQVPNAGAVKDLDASTSQLAPMQPSTAGDALLAAQLQNEDQVCPKLIETFLQC